ncbi:MAG: bacillolysin [Candidatus Rokubacteria bacterium]|nr:bacillolysin [Candidatus Rokubacteria bacterium]
MRNLTSGQQDLLTRLLESAPGPTVRWDDARGVLRLVRGPGLHGARGEAAAAAFLAGYAPLFGPANLARRLRLLAARVDRLGGRHLEYQQEYELGGPGRAARLPVYGSRLAVHFTPAGDLAEVWSNCWRDVAVADRPRVTAARARRMLAKAATAARPPGSKRDRRAAGDDVALPEAPRLVVYPWRGGFRPAWTAFGYAAVRAEQETPPVVEPGDVFLDAITGELFLFFPVRMHVAGTGSGVTPIGGPYVLRALEVEPAGGQLHRLRDATRPRVIVTYRDGCTARAGTWVQRCDALMDAILAGTTRPSENATGPDWLTTSATTLPADREASQQPEVDGHFFAAQAYEWYAAVGGRVGWDNGAFAGSAANLPVRVVTHTRDPNLNDCHTAYSQFWRKKTGGQWGAFVMFCDGNLNATSPNLPRRVDFPVGSKALFGHEYQHVVTFFSFRNDQNEPGIGYDGWAAAFHEGLADAFGCMFADHWTLGSELSHDSPPIAIRNLIYPRDPASWENRPGGLNHANLDHFADRTQPPPGFGWSRAYDHGAILAHCAFLMAAGGVHRREGVPGRAPLIPVRALGTDLVNGAPISRAARIWYEGLASFSATLGQVTTSLIDENIFRGFRDGCESAAIAAYGAGSLEHRTTLLVFHAVGLDEPGVPYGADVTFLRWGIEWQLSRPYLGGIRSTCPNWSSIDLFINNGGASGWNAVIDALGPNGVAIGFENRVYCRVRNVGDQPATNVTVDFFWAKVGSAPTGWQLVTNQAGAVQRLLIAQLATGAMTFDEAQQDTPPPQAGVGWYIPPLAPGETVDHFCLKAVVASPDDVNPYNNEVQSNVAYTILAARGARAFQLDFLLGNPRDEAIDVEVAVDAPGGWKTSVEGRPKRLRPREERKVTLTVRAPAGATAFAPPLDGEVRGRLAGPLAGRVLGALTEARAQDGRVTGRVALDLEGVGVLLGTFEGALDARTGALEGRVRGVFQGAEGKDLVTTVALRGGLRPWRRVDVRQVAGGAVLGGVTVEFRPPPPATGDWPPDPPIATRADALDGER